MGAEQNKAAARIRTQDAASAPARVIAVGSSAHRLLKTADIDALLYPSQAAPWMGSNQRGRYQMRSYQTAKLAVTTWKYASVDTDTPHTRA